MITNLVQRETSCRRWASVFYWMWWISFAVWQEKMSSKFIICGAKFPSVYFSFFFLHLNSLSVMSIIKFFAPEYREFVRSLLDSSFIEILERAFQLPFGYFTRIRSQYQEETEFVYIQPVQVLACMLHCLASCNILILKMLMHEGYILFLFPSSLIVNFLDFDMCVY